MELLVKLIFAVPLFIVSMLLIPFVLGIIGFVVADIFGYKKTLAFDAKDDTSMVATGFWFQWQFWVCVLIGAIHIYLSFLVNETFNFWLGHAYFFSIFALGLIKSRIK